jgi:hypothetical protein
MMMIEAPSNTNKDFANKDLKVKKHIKLSEVNYKSNLESDYTEKIEVLDREFDYQQQRHLYWGEPELSLLYGTPLYHQASADQKLALNHLYWVTQYNQTAATEANAILYNQVTAGVFAKVGGYDDLCQELALETSQERHHIHAFHNIGYRTKRSLLGREGFQQTLKTAAKSAPKSGTSLLDFSWTSSPMSALPESALRCITSKVLLRAQSQYYSSYLQELDGLGEPIPAQTTGLMGQLAPRPLLQFFTLNCGSSPFLSCVFFVTRFMANMLIKNYEYRYSKHCRELERSGAEIPIPIAISHLHLLDESFHTTTSQLIAQELYKDFPNPSAYERFMANAIVRRAQQVIISGLSVGIPATFRSDADFMPTFYQLLQSPLFGFSPVESLHWLEKCFCHEHEGWQVTYRYHQSLLGELRRLFAPIDYLSPVNREMQIMAAGGNIDRSIQSNRQSFQRFSQGLPSLVI